MGLVGPLLDILLPTKTGGGFSNGVKTVVQAFDSGGVADYTGPAWLDGTPGLPERVLSPQQTAAFDALVEAITSAPMIRAPGLYGSMSPEMNGNSGNTFGDIIIQVESLDSDTDINEMADKLMDAIDAKMNRGSVVGGIRMGF